MESLVEKYNQRDENDILRSEVYEEMAEQLTELIWEVYAEYKSGDFPTIWGRTDKPNPYTHTSWRWRVYPL